MPRQAANEAKQAQNTAAGNAAGYGANAAGLYGPLTGAAEQMVNSPGYDPATLAAITNAGMGSTNAAFGSNAADIKRTAARSGNTAGVAAGLDTNALNKGIAEGGEAGGIQVANQNFKNQQRMQGLNMLNSLYGTNVGAQLGQQQNQTSNINAQTQASPGWAQTFSQVLGAVGGAVPKPARG